VLIGQKQKFVAAQFNCWLTAISHDALQTVAQRRSALCHPNLQITAEKRYRAQV
jgi:hypothetical protein